MSKAITPKPKSCFCFPSKEAEKFGATDLRFAELSELEREFLVASEALKFREEEKREDCCRLCAEEQV